MKNKTYRFAAALAVILVLLVFVAPVGATEVTVDDWNSLNNNLLDNSITKITLNNHIYVPGDTVDGNNEKAKHMFTISRDLILDLAGYQINVNDPSSGLTPSTNYAFLTVSGKLTIVDSTNNGLINVTSSAGATEWTNLNRESTIISIVGGGEVIISGGTLEHRGGHLMAYAVDVNSGTGDSKLIVNGGNLKSTYRAVRLFANSANYVANVFVNGGTIHGDACGIWVQQPSGSSTTAQQYNVQVNNGEISGNTGSAIFLSAASTSGTSNLEINGGILSSTGHSAVYYGLAQGSLLTDLSSHSVSISEATSMSSASGYENLGYKSTVTTGATLTEIPLPVQPATPSSSSSSKPTPGAYYNYPRTTENGGLVEFGTSKVVKSVTLPAGSSGKVNLHIDSTAYWPLSVDSEFTFDISVDNLGEGTSYISFKIAESKLTALELTAADVGVYHNVNGEWVKLVVTYTIEDGDVIYTAETDSFSPFKLVIEEGAAVQKEEVTPSEPVVDEPVIPDVPQDVTGEVLPEIPDIQDEPETPASPAPVLGLLAALGAAVVLRRK